MREQLDRVVAEMVDKGVHYDDAQREFERRFIARVVASLRRQRQPRRRRARHAPQHPDPQGRGPQDPRLALLGGVTPAAAPPLDTRPSDLGMVSSLVP